MEPVVFGRYKLLELIGRGGMAEVFLARQDSIAGVGRRLAIKRIHSQFTSDENFVSMFIDEARIVGHFNHPNIVQMIDFGKVHEAYYIAMEYVDGLGIAGVMGHNLKKGTRIPIEAIIEIGLQIGQGMDYAHKEKDHNGVELNIVHRDLTPHNILLSREGSVKITDFGIAKASMNTHMTQAGMIKGKVPYMSPEQAMGETLDQRSDLFSIGIILYEMCTLTRLFHGPSDFHVLQKVIAAEIPSIREQNPDIPEELERIILKLLTDDRDNRYASAGEMVDAMRRLKFNLGERFFDFRLSHYISEVHDASRLAAMPKAEPEQNPKQENSSAFADVPSGGGGFAVDGDDDSEEARTVLIQAHNPELGGEEATRLIQTGETNRDKSITSAVEDLAKKKAPVDLSEAHTVRQDVSAIRADQEKIAEEAKKEGTPKPKEEGASGLKALLIVLLLAALSVLGFLIVMDGPKASLSIKASPNGAKIMVNDQVVSTSGFHRMESAPVGTQLRVQVEKEGYVSQGETLTLTDDQNLVLDFSLKVELPPEGYLILSSEPEGADVIVAGQKTGWKTPRRITLRSKESHTMTLELEGYLPVEKTFTVKGGEESPITVKLEPIPPEETVVPTPAAP